MKENINGFCGLFMRKQGSVDGVSNLSFPLAKQVAFPMKMDNKTKNIS
ncbi:hypothetical protein ACSAZK_17235 [Methanosarcina sp. Mfa9]